ncbi:heme o synthase [Saprospira grandis]|nr:heme o synthase [Saprospira grandis]
MNTNNSTTVSGSLLGQKWKNYMALAKARLALSVVFSACTAYYLGTESFNVYHFLLLGLGGFLVTASANTLNQVLEKDTDRKMKRTQNRPLPAGRMESWEAVLFAGITAAVGLLALAFFNPMTAFLGSVSLVSYAFIYTPLKRISPVAVWVGAVPGALPMAIGWVAATGELGLAAFFLFSLQFLWQFPHFWAIAWVAYKDYAEGGFYLLPSSQKDGRTKETALQAAFYVLCLIAMSWAPVSLGISGYIAAGIMFFMGLFFLYFAIRLFKQTTAKAARQLMLASLVYQLVVFLALMIDKI